MDESVQKLIEKTEKLDVNSKNPKYPTNWCDIPMEMRMECIKWMNFVTRTRLKVTSNTEKLLVEAKKHNFNEVQMVYTETVTDHSAEEKLEVIAEELHVESINNHEKTMNCLVNILKSCEIDTFDLTGYDNLEFERFWPEIENHPPFRFKTFKSRNSKSKLTEHFLKNCDGLETVILDCGDENPDLLDLTDLSVIINAKFFQVTLNSPFVLQRLVRKLLGAPIEITEDYGLLWFLGVINHIAEEFKNRLVYKKDGEIRIRTNDESKHILIRRNREWVMSFYSCTVIPSNLLESEYEKCEWFKELILHEGAEPIFDYEESESEQESIGDFEEEQWYEYDE